MDELQWRGRKSPPNPIPAVLQGLMQAEMKEPREAASQDALQVKKLT